jgi:hypothetical protein
MSILRYSLFLLVFLSFTPKVNAQNLIPNPSFDLVDTCNPSSDWIWNLSSWENLGYYDGIAYGTPDVYNACNVPGFPPIWSFPYTWLTFQYPHSGDGFVGAGYGLHFNRPDIFLTELDRGREYFAAELLEPLQEGIIYCVGGFMNCRNLSIVPADTNSFWEVFTNRISVGFHSNTPPLNNTWLFTGINHICKLTKEDSTLITDTLGWTSIRTPYQASGNEHVIIMGNFFSDTSSGTYFNTDFNLDSIYSLPQNQVLSGFYATFTYAPIPIKEMR